MSVNQPTYIRLVPQPDHNFLFIRSDIKSNKVYIIDGFSPPQCVGILFRQKIGKDFVLYFHRYRYLIVR